MRNKGTEHSLLLLLPLLLLLSVSTAGLGILAKAPEAVPRVGREGGQREGVQGGKQESTVITLVNSDVHGSSFTGNLFFPGPLCPTITYSL